MPDPTQNPIAETMNYNPLINEAPVKKDYQKANIDVASVPVEIPEFRFEKPVIKFDASESVNSPEAEPSKKPTENPESGYANPNFTDLSKKEKRLGAEQAADTALGAYSFVCEKLFVPLASINTQKIEEQIATGEMSDQIAFVVDDEGNQANIRQYATVFNANVSESLKVDEDFIQDVREPLIRIMEKRGLAMTDEQYVALAFGKDLLTKGMIVMELKRSTKTITNMIVEQTALLRATLQPVVQTQPEVQFKEEVKSTPEIVPAQNPVVAPVEELKIEVAPKENNSNFQQRAEIAGMPEFGNPSTLAAIEKMVAEEEGTKIIKPSRRTSTSRTSTTKRAKNQTSKTNNNNTK